MISKSNIRVDHIKTESGKWKNNVYLVTNTASRKSVLIDPSWEADKIESAINGSGSELSAILLTHSHWDHVNLVPHFIRKYHVPVFIGENEPTAENLKLFDIQKVKDGEVLIIGNMEIKTYETPGHTAGSICYRIGDFLFTGDTVFIEGCGICDSNEDACKMFESIQRLKREIPESTMIFPGHTYLCEAGKPMSYLYENNVYIAFNRSELFVNFRMRSAQKELFNFK